MPFQRYIFLLLLTPLFISAQQSIVKNYTAIDGLPVSKIYDCSQDSTGNMWFAAEGGLIEYDGTNWTHYDSLNGSSINYPFGFIKIDSNNTFWAIPKQNKERIWFKKDNNWNYIEPLTDIPDNYVSCDLLNSRIKTQLLLVTKTSQAYLVSIDSVHEIPIPELNKRQIYSGKFIEDKILFSTDDGIYKYDRRFNEVELIPQTSGKIIYSFEYDSAKDRLSYFASNEIGIIINGERKTINLGFNVYFHSSDYTPPNIRTTSSGNIYFGTIFALYRYSTLTNTIHELNTNDGFVSTGASSIFSDYERNIWFTSFRGINKIRNSPFENFTSNDLLLEDEVTSISKFPNGPYVFAHNIGFTFWHKNRFTSYSFPQNSTRSFSRVLNTAYDSELDVIWFTAQKLGLGYITRNLEIKWKVLQIDSTQISYSSLLPSSGQKLFYSTNLGLHLLKGNNSIQIIDNTSINIRRLTNYNDSLIIAATKKGILLYNKLRNTYEIVSADDNSKNNLYDIYKLRQNEWLAASSSGLLLFDGSTLKDFDKLSISQPIYFIRPEGEFLWFGLMGGAIRWNTITGSYRHFTSQDGLLGVETNRDAFLFNKNHVFIGTDSGLSVFAKDNYNEIDYEIKPKIHFEGYEDNRGNFYKISETPSFKITDHPIVLKYNSPSFIDESAITYTIIINNLDEGTSEIFNTKSVDYEIRNLSPSSYNVGLFATNINNVSSDTLYSAQIVINPPFYLETWFFILMAFLSIAASYSLYDYLNKNRYSKELELKVADRTKQLEESEKNIRQLTQRVFKAQEEQRERIARDLHDNIAQDMAMIKIEIEKLIKDNDETDIHNNWLTNKVTELTKYLRDMSYFLHPNAIKQTGFINAVQSLCNDFIIHSKIEIEFFSNLEDGFELHEEVSTNIYRFIQEALTNIRKHSHATNGIVILVKRDESLIIRIEDDGIGFNREEINQSKSSRSMGLRSMEERILFVGGKLKIKSTPNEGTKLSAEIPLSALHHFNSLINSDQTSG